MHYIECDKCGKAVSAGNIMKRIGSFDKEIQMLKRNSPDKTWSFKDLQTNLCKSCFISKYKNKTDPSLMEKEVEIEKTNRRTKR